MTIKQDNVTCTSKDSSITSGNDGEESTYIGYPFDRSGMKSNQLLELGM